MSDKIRTNIEPVGLIGGTGFYSMELEEPQSLKVETPYGTCNAESGLLNGKKVVFVARHGTKHSILPHEVNYRTNIYDHEGAYRIIEAFVVDYSSPPGASFFIIILLDSISQSK